MSKTPRSSKAKPSDAPASSRGRKTDAPSTPVPRPKPRLRTPPRRRAKSPSPISVPDIAVSSRSPTPPIAKTKGRKRPASQSPTPLVIESGDEDAHEVRLSHLVYFICRFNPMISTRANLRARSPVKVPPASHPRKARKTNLRYISLVYTLVDALPANHLNSSGNPNREIPGPRVRQHRRGTVLPPGRQLSQSRGRD